MVKLQLHPLLRLHGVVLDAQGQIFLVVTINKETQVY
jgi:hypothetical protein